jgi:hypothetical protein
VSRLGGSLCLAAVVVGLASCSVKVSDVTVVGEEQFNAVWAADWAAVNAAAKPLVPSAGLPGVCNPGGGANACARTSRNMVAALSKLKTDLAAVHTPPQFAAASMTIQRASQIQNKGMTDLSNAIAAQDNTLFNKAKTELTQGATLFVQGYALFPSGLHPSPQPFGCGVPGCHTSA